ncbi:hypothetical protein HHI36_015913 [Cryptolaemus montrouzieri]|uniref:Uncharacterized protein n=1 Tax=Cryptolaemus montrouzieri TaxID=559131 RepID=A0ABD2N6V3_9CUCU
MELDKQPLQVHAADQNAAVPIPSSATKKPKSDGITDSSIIENHGENSFVPTVGRWGSEWPRGTEQGVLDVTPYHHATTGLNRLDELNLWICPQRLDEYFDYSCRRRSPSPPIRYNDNNNTQGSLYELLDKTQVEHVWPEDHPLPLPKWHGTVQKAYKLEDAKEYQKLCWEIEIFLQKLLEDLNYDTVDNLLTFYRAYKKWGNGNLVDFFRSYSPPICPPNLTCVGLALELWNRLHALDVTFPNLSEYFFIASCEEHIESLSEYLSCSENLEAAAYTLEKEHVLLGLKIQIGNRQGILISDPGYHVGRVVTAMKDGAYPHTGWFTQSDENNLRKEYNYQYSTLNDAFIEWNTRTVKNDVVQESQTALIHISRAYLTAVDVTERRNLVYNFKSLLSRDQKGHLIAGIYFKIKENCDEFTLFYRDKDKRRVKMKFSDFNNASEMDGKTLLIVNLCNEQLNLPKDALPHLLRELGNMLQDVTFVSQVLGINNAIGSLTEQY